MPPTVKDIVEPVIDDGKSLERVKHRKHALPFVIAEPNPAWPQRFAATKARIEAAIGLTALEIQHVGSTSVPGLPAKDVVDVDLVVNDIDNEAAYVQQLEAADFSFLFREPAWYQHRFFVDEADRPGSYHINLHVFGPDCGQVARHKIFRDWLLEHPEDRDLYAKVKRECAAASEAAGESMQQYTERKDATIVEIRNKAFRELGYIK